MHGLTYGVIRVDSEEKLSVLTVQDVGLVMPGGECGRWAAHVGSGGRVRSPSCVQRAASHRDHRAPLARGQTEHLNPGLSLLPLLMKERSGSFTGHLCHLPCWDPWGPFP